MEGKDGNSLNEVRMLCDAIMENQGPDECEQGDSPQAGKLDPEAQDRQRERLNAGDFTWLSKAFFDEIEKRYP